MVAYVTLGLFGTWHPGSNTYDECRPAMATLCKKSGLSKSTMRRAIVELTELGAVVSQERPGQPTIYQLQAGSLEPPPSMPKARTRVKSDTGTRVKSGRGRPATRVTGDTPTRVTGDTPPVSLVTPYPEGKTHNQGPREAGEPTAPLRAAAKTPAVVGEVVDAPSTTLATVDRSPAIGGNGDITAGWIDHCKAHGVTLPPTAIKRYAAKIKEMRTGGIPDVVIKKALAAMLNDNEASRPSLLDNYVVRIQQGPPRGAPRPGTRTEQSTRDLLGSPDSNAAAMFAEMIGGN